MNREISGRIFLEIFKVIDNNKFIYFIANLCLASVVYLTVGSKLSIEYLVSLSLAVTGGVWSYLSIEISKVKEVRAEYLKSLEELELSVTDFGAQSTVLFSLYDVIYAYSKDELRDKIISLGEKRNELARSYSLLMFKITRLSNSKYNKKQFSDMSESIYSIFLKLDNYFIQLENKDLVIDEEDEKDFLSLYEGLMNKMSEVFSDIDVGFESFSEEYYLKKIVCFSVISICLMTVFLKAFF